MLQKVAAAFFLRKKCEKFLRKKHLCLRADRPIKWQKATMTLRL